MPFIIVEHETKPMKLKGNKVIPATISPTTVEKITEGEYIGVDSGLIIRLINVGGFIKHFSFERKLIPATFDERASKAIIGEVFIALTKVHYNP